MTCSGVLLSASCAPSALPARAPPRLGPDQARFLYHRMAAPTGMQCRLLIPPLNLKMRRTRPMTTHLVLEALASAGCISCACFRPVVVHLHGHGQLLLNYMFAMLSAASKPMWRKALEKALKSNKYFPLACPSASSFPHCPPLRAGRWTV